jgi:hypothetical protein
MSTLHYDDDDETSRPGLHEPPNAITLPWVTMRHSDVDDPAPVKLRRERRIVMQYAHPNYEIEPGLAGYASSRSAAAPVMSLPA